MAETGGSNASVFECLVDGWLCAMKELDMRGVGDSVRKGFETEIEVLEALPYHPNILVPFSGSTSYSMLTDSVIYGISVKGTSSECL